MLGFHQTFTDIYVSLIFFPAFIKKHLILGWTSSLITCLTNNLDYIVPWEPKGCYLLLIDRETFWVSVLCVLWIIFTRLVHCIYTSLSFSRSGLSANLHLIETYFEKNLFTVTFFSSCYLHGVKLTRFNFFVDVKIIHYLQN